MPDFFVPEVKPTVTNSSENMTKQPSTETISEEEAKTESVPIVSE